jgi:hypothetical protein
MSNTLGLIFAIFIVFAILTVDSLSSYLVKRFITEQGGKILECHLAEYRSSKYPLTRSEPIYRVHFTDKTGNEHKSYVRISFISGVTMEEDQIVKPTGNQQR